MVAKNRNTGNHHYSHRMINNTGSGEQSVEAYKNPTELFQWINFGRWNKAIKRLKSNPSEACVWIYSENESNGKKKWKYLPIHMVCLQANPPLSIVEALLEAYPRGARCRDLDGNLALHYLCLEACTDKQVLEVVINAYEESLLEKDKHGRTAYQIMEFETDRRRVDPALRDSVLQYVKWKQTNNYNHQPNHTYSNSNHVHADSRNDDEIARQIIQASNSREVAATATNTITSGTNKQNKKLQQQLREATQERDALRDQVDAVLKESKSSRKLITSLTHQLDKISNSTDQQTNDHKESFHQLQADLNTHKNQITSLSQQLDSTNASLRQEQAKSASVANENAALKERIQSLTQENFQFLQQVDQHKVVDMELTSLREQLHKIKQTLTERNTTHDTTQHQIDLLNQKHQSQIDDLKRSNQKRLDDQKSSFQNKIESHKSTLQNKFEELKAAYQKKLDEQRNAINTQHQNEIQIIKEEHKFDCDAFKQKAAQTLEQVNEKHASKIDEITKQLWKTEESTINDMKRLYQRKLDELKLDHKNVLENFKSSYQSKFSAQTNEYRKNNDQLQVTNRELDILRNEKLKCTEENFELRRKLDQQEIDFDKKLMNVRKAVASQADAFASLQNHFNSNNNSANVDENSIINLSLSSHDNNFHHTLPNTNTSSLLESYLTDNNNNKSLLSSSSTDNLETTRNKLITITTDKHALEMDLLQYKKQNTIFSNENASLRQQYQQMSDEYNIVQSSLKQAKELENTLTKREEDKVRLILSQREDLQAELDLFTNRNKKLKAEICDLEDDNMKQKKDRERVIDELTDKITISQDKIIELRDMVNKNKASYQEKLDSLTSSYNTIISNHNIIKSENATLTEKITQLEPSLQHEQSINKQLEQEKALLGQKLDELQGIANGLQNDNEDLIEKQQQMKASMVANNNNSSSSNLSTNSDNNIIKHKLNQLLHENEQHKETILQQQESIRSLTDKITSYQKKIKILAIDKSAGRQGIVDELTEKITSLASSLLHLSNLQNRIVQSSVHTEKLYQRAAIEERQLLLSTITKQEREYDTNIKKRDRLMKAMQRHEEDLSKEASLDREAILKDIYAKEEERKMKTAKDRECILNAVLKLQHEIELVSSDVALL